MSDSASAAATRRLAEQGAAPSLTVVSPSVLAGARIVVSPGDRVLLGRAGQFALESVGMSRQHAWLDYDGDTLVITDAGSTNGTTVNGRRIERPTALADVDTVGLGELQAVVALGDGRGASASASLSSWLSASVSDVAPLQDTGPQELAPQELAPQELAPQELARQAVLASETTRELCVAVQTDRGFREYVLDEIVDEPFRAICPSYGVDLVTVAMHAIAAQRRLLLRDAVLAVLLLALLFAAVTRWGSNSSGSLTRWLVEAVILVLFLAWLVVVAARLFEGYGVLVRQLAASGGPTDPPRVTVTPRLRRVLDDIRSTQGGNVTVFSDYLPFVGSGMVFDRWSFAIDLERGAVDRAGTPKAPRPFSAGDLYDALRSNLATTGIAELRVEERLHVHGMDVRKYHELMPDKFGRPVPRASQELLRDALNSPSGAARTYLSIQATGWRGELVATIFFRAVRLPSALYLEGTSTALLPLANEFRAASGRPRDALGVILESLSIGSVETIPSLLLSPVRAVRGTARPLRSRQRRRDQRQRIEDGTFDYGSVTSVREEAAGSSFNRYYLEFDRDMYDKVLQERLLQHVSDFLKAHDVDTAAFGQQMTNIHMQNTYNNNQNVQHMSGGTFFGSGARVNGGVTSPAGAAGQNSGGG